MHTDGHLELAFEPYGLWGVFSMGCVKGGGIVVYTTLEEPRG